MLTHSPRPAESTVRSARGATFRACVLGGLLAAAFGLGFAPADRTHAESGASNFRQDPAPTPVEPKAQDEKPKPAGKAVKPGGTKPAAAKPDERGFVPLGSVRFHPKKQIIEADGWFNLNRGIIEFLACAPGVKAHETMLALDIDPVDLNLALIALGLKAKRQPESEWDLRPIAGDRVVIFLRYTITNAEGKPEVVERRAEECIINYLAEADMAPVGFVYTGSQFIPKDPLAGGDPNDPAVERRLGKPKEESEKADDGEPKKKQEMIYAPRELGQFIALTHRPFAILDNPLSLPYPDPEYGANTEVLPKVFRNEEEDEEPVRVTIVIRRPKKGEIDEKIIHMPFRMREPIDPPKEDDGGDDGAGDDGNRR
ncbi:MAG: YdjY domain-containing protein [Planctomycetota bacterium]